MAASRSGGGTASSDEKAPAQRGRSWEACDGATRRAISDPLCQTLNVKVS